MLQPNEKPLGEQLCNKSYNSYKGSFVATEKNCSLLERKIVEVLEVEERKLGPKEIQTLLASEKYGKFIIKGGSLRPLLKRLDLKGLIVYCERGFYCSWRTYEVRLKPLKVHDVRISCEVSEKLVSWEFEKKIGGVKVHVCFGSERSKITGGLYCDEGMNRDTCMFALDKWANVAEKRLGRELKDFCITALHVNRDEFNAGFDGSLHCATRDVLKNLILERVYEKEEGLRHELVVNKNMVPQELEETIFSKGMKAFVSNTASFETERRLSHIEGSTKSVNQKIQDVSQRLNVMSQTLIRKAEGEESLIKAVSQVTAQTSNLLLEVKNSNERQLNEFKEFFAQYTIKKDREVEEYKRLFLEALSAMKPILKTFEDLSKVQQPKTQSEKEQPIGPIPDFYTR